jgi:hypothetical protein
MFFFSVGKFYRKKQIDMKYVKKKTKVIWPCKFSMKILVKFREKN